MDEKPEFSIGVLFATESAVLDYASEYGGWIGWSDRYTGIYYWFDAMCFTQSACLKLLPGNAVVGNRSTFQGLKASIA